MAVRQLNRIKAVLTEKGRTNQWLAARLSKNEATVSRWCTNSSQPSLEMLYDIAYYLDVDIRELLNKTK
jgi:transcriptional regulator with XRE-family HTH domain